MRAILVGVRYSVLRDLAGDDVHLVAVGERDEDVGVGDAGGLQHRGIGGVAGHRAHVDAILQFAQRRPR